VYYEEADKTDACNAIEESW